ncbi:MAG TPA: hypothetical protein DDY14_17625 [Chromatiaceae bacterium]|jgi:hypothetical protein|nr:MAG: hypothetical protein N838_00885 [Thiohalocapsa sp. PB-PSB1]QQO57416.1 MAG: hypothetical protein N838_32765 [Thiohalocapsa sp. PB-PSB1]HBG97100.1 hypothetical protein [Chromatiaceae bacterium]HCS92615.1 hypothetical protein [Chromatiaceae bacterium]
MLTKTKLVSAVALAVGTSGLVISAAHADAVFFHNLAGSPTVASIITVMNTSANNFDPLGAPIVQGAGDDGNLHYRFYYKQPSTDPELDTNLLPCQEFNEFLPTSRNDVQTIDLSGYFGEEVGGINTGVMFNDPSVNNRWKTGQTYAMGAAVVPYRGYLIVENADVADGTFSIAGESFVMEYGVGATWGYHSYMIDGDDSTPNYADYLPFASASPSIVSIMPIDDIRTSFLITVVDEDQLPFGEFDEETTISYGNADNPIGIWDRDERPISGAQEQTVVCIGSIVAQDLLPTASQNRLADGGWANLYNYREERDRNGNVFNPPVITEPSGVIVKLEFNLGDTIDGQPVSGTFNNALLLRP